MTLVIVGLPNGVRRLQPIRGSFASLKDDGEKQTTTTATARTTATANAGISPLRRKSAPPVEMTVVSSIGGVGWWEELMAAAPQWFELMLLRQ